MGIPPGEANPPPGMGVVLLYVPQSAIAQMNPLDMQADLGLPWAGPNGEPFWFDEHLG